MRLTLLALIFALTCLNGYVYAQSTDSVKQFAPEPRLQIKKNELKINLLYGVLGIAEVTYERAIGQDQAVGASVLVGFDDEINYNFSILPYYRMYFGGKPATGFFIEGNAGLLNYREDSYFYSDNSGYFSVTNKNKMSFGAGLAVGGKFLNKNGLFGEVYAGLGRLFSSQYEDVYPRAGITLGKRF